MRRRTWCCSTVSGTIGESNRGPLDPKKDSLLALNKIEFNKAFAFDRPTLVALEQGTVTVQPREFDKPAHCSARCSAISRRRS